MTRLLTYPVWTGEAACVGHDPEIWFPQPRVPGNNYRLARKICASCPVRQECLAMAMEAEQDLVGPSRAGMFGGLNPEERAALAGHPPRRKYPRKVPRPEISR